MKYILFFFLIINYASSQTIEVKYYENPIIKNQDHIKKLPEFLRKDFEPNRFSYTLSYNNGISVYKNENFLEILIDDKVYTETNIILNDEVTSFEGTVENDENRFKHKEKLYYKDLVNNEIYYTQMGYQVKDNPISWKWEITNETLTIAGYSCKKAISKFRGGYFEAWYTESISVNAGPDKFDGLPGLILYMKTEGMEIIAQSINFPNKVNSIEKPNFDSKTYIFNELYNLPVPQPKVEKSPGKNIRTVIIK